MNRSGRKTTDEIQRIHIKVHEVIKRANESYVKKANMGKEENGIST